MLNDEGKDSKPIYNFAQIDFCSQYIGFALLELLSNQTFVLLPSPNPNTESSVLELFRCSRLCFNTFEQYTGFKPVKPFETFEPQSWQR